jgi:hypothetical protein
MIRRLFVGLVLGLIIGGLVAAGLVAGLHVTAFLGGGGAVLAYLAAALTGTLTGLFAGKPIWATNAKVEAGLKAFFGALIGTGLMFALREWGGGFHVDMSALNAGGAGPLGELPAASLPLIAAVLGAFFELDNTGGGGEEGQNKATKALPEPRKRVGAGSANGKAQPRASAEEELEGDDEASAGPPHAKNR